MGVGQGFDYWTSVLRKKAVAGGFDYRCHLLPHDIEAREISTANSRRAALLELLPKDEPIITVPRIRSKEDGIHAARALLGSAYFDNDNCKVGLALGGYHRARWASRCVDQSRTHTEPRPRPPPSLPPDQRPLGLPCSGAAPCAVRGRVG
jgi:hypothetical protein